MHILIIGGGGMVGQKLAGRLATAGLATGTVSKLTLFDISKAHLPRASFAVSAMTGDLTDQSRASALAAMRPDLVYHLAATVSGDAEANFEKGWDTNVRGTWQLLDALRYEHEASGGTYRPKLVFTSSIAVFGPPYPDRIGDEFLCAPQTSYGAQKAVAELLVADYSRKGMIDGLSLRLPTICVRPGKPNLAASSFFSGIIREPLNGHEAALPVDDTVRHWHASPRSAARFLTHAADLDFGLLGTRRSLNLPGVSCTVAEQIEALRKIAGEDVVRLIRPKPDRTIIGIVSGWPRDFDPQRALDLGFSADRDFEEIIRVYIEDDLGGPDCA